MTPQLVKLQAELEDSGFVIVAPHVQNVPQDRVVAFLRSQKVNYTITDGGQVPGNPVSGIPAAFLFDSSGKLVEKGHPAQLKSRAQELVASGPHWLAAGREYTKLKPLAESLKKTKAWGPLLKKLQSEAKKGGEAEEEATFLSERLLAHGSRRLEEAKALEADDAFAAQHLYAEVSAQFKGAEPGKAADERLKELKKDKDFQAELKASMIAAQVRAECDKLVAQQGKIDLDYAPNKRPAATIRQAASALKKKYPESKAASRLAEELKTYGFKDV